MRLLLCVIVFVFAAGIESRPALAQQRFIDQVPGLKADSLVLFGYYFKWPANAVPGKEFVIGLLGDAPFTRQRVTAEFGTVGKKKIRVLAFDSAKDYQPCHILFVANDATPESVERTARARLAAAIKRVQGSPVLVVTEDAGAAKRGALANFVVDTVANRVNVEVNEAAVKNGQLGFTKFYLVFRKTKRCVVVKPNN